MEKKEKIKWYWEDEGKSSEGRTSSTETEESNSGSSSESQSIGNIGAMSVFSQAFGAIHAEMKENSKELVLRIDMPGFRKEDISIGVSKTQLEINAETSRNREKKTREFYGKTSSSRSFSKLFTLPAAVDASRSKAKLVDGVLTIHLPKMYVKKRKNIGLD